MPVSCEFCVLSGTGPCDGPISRPEKPYRVCVCVCVCVFEWLEAQQCPSALKMSK
jgi:hypothetical protein